MVTPRRDLLEGLIGGLLFVQDTPPMKQREQQEPAAAPQPEQQGSATAMAQRAASAAIRRLRPSGPASGLLHPKQSPLLALCRSAIVLFSADGANQ